MHADNGARVQAVPPPARVREADGGAFSAPAAFLVRVDRVPPV